MISAYKNQPPYRNLSQLHSCRCRPDNSHLMITGWKTFNGCAKKEVRISIQWDYGDIATLLFPHLNNIT